MTAPIQPTNVVLQTGINSSGTPQNLLTWDFISGSTSYNIYRSLDGVTFSFLSAAASLNPQYSDAAVNIGTQYWYSVTALNGALESSKASSLPSSIVPCLPGQVNLGYLRYMSKLAADMLQSNFLTKDEWNWNINQSACELYDELITCYGDDYFVAPPLIIQTNGTGFIPFPNGSNYVTNGIPAPALYKLTGVDGNLTGQGLGPASQWTTLSRFNWIDRNKYNVLPGFVGIFGNFVQISYRPMGNSLELIPIPAANTQIQIWYAPILQQMLLDTDMLPFSISGWSEYVIVDAAIKALRKQELLEQAGVLMNQKASLQERIRASAPSRDIGQANSVSNTRSSCGDPSFNNCGMNGGNGWFGGGGYG
jgi:hypothetical protein